MSDQGLFADAFMQQFRKVIREEIAAANGKAQPQELLTADELAAKLKVPKSWIYEQSRQDNIPTHRLGRYVRFDLKEVIATSAAMTASDRADKKLK
jgi:excisionase family DNA binding protein